MVALDVIRCVFTGSQFTKTLATVEFNFTQPVVSFETRWADWKRIKPGTYNGMLLGFHDMRGGPLKNTTLTLVLQVKKRSQW